MRISEADIGQDFIVVSVLISREVGRRLADMGFTEGARGRVIRGGAFRGPLQVRIRDYDVLIRRCEAAGIEVTPAERLASEPARGRPSLIPPRTPGIGPVRPGRGRHGHGAWRKRRGTCPDEGLPSRETDR